MKVKKANLELENMLASLSSVIDRTDVIGYTAAKNTLAIQGAITAYIETRDRLIEKYGDQETDANGVPTGRMHIDPSMDDFPAFLEELQQIATRESKVTVETLPYAEAIGKISGTQLLALDWMFEEGD